MHGSLHAVASIALLAQVWACLKERDEAGGGQLQLLT